MTDNNNIEVILTDPHEFHCFKLVFRAKPGSADAAQRVPIEIFLHTTQAIDLLHKLSLAISEKHRQDSAELLEIRSRVLTPEERERQRASATGQLQGSSAIRSPRVQGIGSKQRG